MEFEEPDNNDLTPTGLAHQLEAELISMAELLSPNHQRITKKFVEYILQWRSSIAKATQFLAVEAALFVIQVLEHEYFNREISDLHNRLNSQGKQFNEQIEKLEGEIKALKKTTE